MRGEYPFYREVGPFYGAGESFKGISVLTGLPLVREKNLSWARKKRIFPRSGNYKFDGGQGKVREF